MSIAIPSRLDWWRWPLILPQRRKIERPRLALSNIFRWRGADRGHSCPTCGCTTPGSTTCTACCGTTGPTAWDLDLSGLTFTFGGCGGNGGCTTTDCAALQTIISLAYTSSCTWKYQTTVCTLKTMFFSLIISAPVGGFCAYNLSISSNVCTRTATYTASIAPGSCNTAVTLTLVGSGGGGLLVDMICDTTWPNTIAVTPA